MSVHKKPSARQIQPMGFWGRLEAIRTPTTGKAKKDTENSRSSAMLLVGTWTDRARNNSATPAADMVSVRQARDHAS